MGRIWRKAYLVVAVVAMALAMAVPAVAQQKVLVGLVTSLSGVYASIGEDQIRGSQYAAEEIGGKVLGKPIELVPVDDEAKPGVGARRVREAIQSKGVKYFNGAVSSGVALAVGQVVNEEKAIYVTSVGADEVTGSQCNRHVFRWSLPTYGAIEQTVRPLLKKFPNAKRWYTITPDYIFGHSLLNNTTRVLKEFSAEHVGNDMHPIGHTEFSSFITKAMASKANVVVFLNFGKDTINALKQAHNFGLGRKAKILVAWSSGLRDMEEVGPEFCEGVYFGCQFWHDVDVPLTKKLNEVWLKKFNRYPSYTELSAYIMTKLEFMGMEKAGTTDVEAVIKALEGMKYDGLTGPEEIQAFDHQVKKNYYLLLAKAKKDIRGPGDNASIVSFGVSVKSQAESDCRMK
jgi:branched-chain amino acid transport system substrate-binding protein